MKDRHLTTPLPGPPHKQYRVGILEPADAELYVPAMVAITRTEPDPGRLAERYQKLISRRWRRAEVTVAEEVSPVGGIALAGYGIKRHSGYLEFSPVGGEAGMPLELYFYLRELLNPGTSQIPPAIGRAATIRELIAAGEIDRYAIP